MTLRRKELYPVYIITFLYFLAYSVLSWVRHAHLESYGFDLGIADQLVWLYSRVLPPVTTIDHIPFISGLWVHVEFIYLLVSPIYRLFPGAGTLLVLQALAVASSGIAVFLLAARHKVHTLISYALCISYLSFYGVQQAVWFDVHSAVFGAAAVMWFIYFLDRMSLRLAFVSFLLAVSCKENVAAMTLLISLVYMIVRRRKQELVFAGLSAAYLIVVFGIYFGHIVPGGYRFSSPDGLFAGMSVVDMFNTAEKRQVIGVTLAWTGFLSVLAPVFLIPVFGNLASYFILGRGVSTAQGLFLQYRIELAPLLFLATVYGIRRYKGLNRPWLAVYLLICMTVFQYMLHLPLSYLTKRYFWNRPVAAGTVKKLVSEIPPDAPLVAQNNIVPHVSARSNIFVLWPEKKDFPENSPCGEKTCDWFRWSGKPAYLIVDTDARWDIRHLLTDRTSFENGLRNLETAGVIRKYKQSGTTAVYTVR